MANSYTTEQLIALVRRIGAFPDVAAEGKEDSDIVDVLNIVMLDELIPSIARFQEDHWLRTVTRTIAATPNFYAFPSRAIGNTLRDVYYESTNQQRRQYLPLLNREVLPMVGITSVEVPQGFMVQGDGIELQPPGKGGNLKFTFMIRPGQLVLSAAYRRVVSVDSTTSVTVDSTVPTGWTTSNLFDVHSSDSGAETRVFDFGVSTVSGTTVTFTSLIDGSVDGTRAVQANDYVVLAEEAAIPGLTREAHPILAQAAACRLLEADGDTEMLRLSRQTLSRQLDNLGYLLETRVEGKPKKLSNRNSFIWRQASRGGW